VTLIHRRNADRYAPTPRLQGRIHQQTRLMQALSGLLAILNFGSNFIDNEVIQRGDTMLLSIVTLIRKIAWKFVNISFFVMRPLQSRSFA
jgi:hypothetical protein